MLTLETSAGEFQINFKFDRDCYGDRTTACKMFVNGEEIIESMAYCSPKDNFSKVLGRKIAFGRAVEYLTKPMFGAKDYSLDHTTGSNKQLRTELWNAYFALPMKTR